MGEVLAVIPARSGSKSVKNKNIRLINGKPMIAYSIGHAKQAACIDRVIVSTDSEEYAEIARKYGAETPFIRPAQYATDTALDIDVFVHALEFLKQEVAYKMWFKDEANMLHPVMTDIPECYNMPRQQLPKIYYQNACIDVVRADIILKEHSMSGKKIAGYDMDENFDIDTEEEFRAAEQYLIEKENNSQL